ncbi:AraC family transcriptional regulator [Dickeya lacustris]|uniref:AraC family transcriptional regulator n=1 Tax=Dickeya lacustris TaxID=2259638 RepID=A0ABY8G3K4_9GAMM|nr:AraC family transcriptional regulator [Dickeya lacustris]WFN54536.1 AraC family transcriptional regulator [Dickeya lacustris]
MALQSTEWFSRNGIECSRVIACHSGFPRHLHDEYVISANLTGIEEIWLSGKTAFVKSGEVTLYNPGTIQASRFGSQSVDFVSVHLPQSVIKTLADEDNLRSDHEAPFLREGILNNPRLFHSLCRFTSSARQDSSVSQEQEQELMVLCGELLETHAVLQGNDEKRIGLVIEYLREHLNVKPELEKLAHIAGLSKYHFVRLFTQRIGMPPLQYHMQLRLHQARNLLRRNIHPIDTAIALGFYDQSHFINSFRKVMGTTPHYYISQVGSAHNKFPIA